MQALPILTADAGKVGLAWLLARVLRVRVGGARGTAAAHRRGLADVLGQVPNAAELKRWRWQGEWGGD